MADLIVIGLKHQVAQTAINECYRQMKSGTPVAPGARMSGLLGGDFEWVIGEVFPSYFKQYMGWALWLCKRSDFHVLQIIYPRTAGVFPWEPAASDGFKNWQPLLANGTVRDAG